MQVCIQFFKRGMYSSIKQIYVVTIDAYEKCVADLESGKYGFAFSSGMAAADTILSLLNVGDEVLAMEDLYGGTRRLFEKVRANKSGLTFKFADFSNHQTLESNISKVLVILFIM